MSLRKIAILTAVLLACSALIARPNAAPGPATATPTVFLTEKDGRLYQSVNLTLPSYLSGNFHVAIEQGGERSETVLPLPKLSNTAQVQVPACPAGSCPTRIEIRAPGGELKSKIEFDLPYQRRWKIYLAPFSHIDVGFTNSQRKILAQNLDNLRAALKLIEQTKDYPEAARFKFFTEVSWPTSEFLYSDATTKEEKEKLIAAMKAGQVEVGGFLISHQNKFLPAEALFRSPDTALKINRDYGVPIRTACIDDVMDFSSIVKPLWGAQIPYFIGGANTNHYVVPPLFYLQPPVGNEKILAWITPNLNGYGEDTDFAMKPALPVTEPALTEIASRLGPYLRSLETDGVPPKIVRDHFDFYGAHWDYPFDYYLLPYYPAHAVDNGGQDITPSDLARLWNQKYAYPKLIIATPAEFFQQAEVQSKSQIPTLRGDLPGFWGEQIFFAQAQTDPERTGIERSYDWWFNWSERDEAARLLQGHTINNIEPKIAEAFRLMTLNNDHNPGPVPFGNTKYSKQDVAEWKSTRRQWINEIVNIGRNLPEPIPPFHNDYGHREVSASKSGSIIILENKYYRVEIDAKVGGISRLFDKDLNRELVGQGPFLLNQYILIARGEDAGIRGNLFCQPGFTHVQVEIDDKYAEVGNVTARITGQISNGDAVKVLTRFIKEAIGIRVPGFLIKAIAPLLGVNLGPVSEVTQEITLRDGPKAIHFTQKIKLQGDQIIDHAFAYPLNVPGDRPLIVEGPYNPYRFGPVAPFGNADLIPGAKMMDPKFPGINALTQVFSWMYGMPADAVFGHYVLALGDGFGIAFSSDNSGVILPGPLDKDPVKGPFGGGFQHLVLGWTAYGHSFLGAPPQGEYTFESFLTSFEAKDENEAKTKAARFVYVDYPWWDTQGDWFSKMYRSSNQSVLIARARSVNDKSLLLRLYESSGIGGETKISFPPDARTIASATRARSDGVPLSKGELKVEKNAFSIKLGPGEVATVRVELP